jgi:drug/metabolite transporter (DMT)-like permease
MAAAGVAWAVYTLVGRGSDDPLRNTAQNFILTLPMALVGLASLALAPLALPAIGWAIISGALASGIGYAVWYAALPQLTRTRAGVVQLTVPAIAALGGILFLGESLTWRFAISGALILGGVAVAILAPTAGAKRSGPPNLK